MDLNGVTALVTGGSQRIGKSMVLALAEAGCNLILHYNRSAEAAEQTAAEAQGLGATVVLKQANLNLSEGAAELVDVAGTGLSPVQVVVNSAAVFPKDTLLDMSVDQWSNTFRVNLRAPVLVTQAFARALPSELNGAVINMTDWRTARPYPDHFSYTITKGALDAFTRTAALSLAPRVRVNAIALGAMLPPPEHGQRYLEELAATLPLQRSGGTQVVADTLLYILRNDFMTGEIVRLNGGAHLKHP